MCMQSTTGLNSAAKCERPDGQREGIYSFFHSCNYVQHQDRVFKKKNSAKAYDCTYS